MEKNDKPPLFNSWRGWYLTVILFLVVLIICFALITQHFA